MPLWPASCSACSETSLTFSDERVLALIDIDGRLTAPRIARNLGVSESTVRRCELQRVLGSLTYGFEVAELPSNSRVRFQCIVRTSKFADQGDVWAHEGDHQIEGIVHKVEPKSMPQPEKRDRCSREDRN